jgi:hypothetical protein
MNKYLIAAFFSVLMLASCSTDKDRESISSIISSHLDGIAKGIRESGVTSISVDSIDIDFKWRSAVAAANITFNVYNPITGDTREDKDIATFYLKKSSGEWQITDSKYQKTKW